MLRLRRREKEKKKRKEKEKGKEKGREKKKKKGREKEKEKGKDKVREQATLAAPATTQFQSITLLHLTPEILVLSQPLNLQLLLILP